VDVPKVTRSSRFNNQKGEFDELRVFLNQDWDQTLSPDDNDLDDMWAILKSILLDGMERYIPKTKNMTTLKCSTLQPFNSDIKQLIHKKHRAWTRFMETRKASVMQEYKRLRNQVRSGEKQP